MKTKKGYTIGTARVGDEAGIHARPSALIKKECNDYPEEVYLRVISPFIRETASCKDYLGLVALGAEYQNEIRIYVKGTDENAKNLCLKLEEILSLSLEEIDKRLSKS